MDWPVVYGLCPRYPQLQGSSSAAGSVAVFIPRPAINRWVRAEAGQIHNFENRASPRNDLIKCRNPLTQEMPEYQTKKIPAFASKAGIFGLGERIRTSGLLNPIQARYQTAPHPVICFPALRRPSEPSTLDIISHSF